MPAPRINFDTAEAMYNSGLSLRDVALAHNCSWQAIHTGLKRRNAVLRSNLRFGANKQFSEDSPGPDEPVYLITHKAIARGRLIKKPCECCGAGIDSKRKNGSSAIHAHHDDYNKPLEVRWLCSSCHHKWHQTHEPVRRTTELPPKTQRKLTAWTAGQRT